MATPRHASASWAGNTFADEASDLPLPYRGPATLSPKVVELEGDFTHQLLHTRGVRLHSATAGDPADPLVILLHDSFGGWFDFRECLPLLASYGFHVAAIDLRGYGLSDKPPAGYDHYGAVGDILGCIGTLGHDTAHLVGIGAGASLAWLAAAHAPEQVASLVTSGAISPNDMRRAIATHPWLFTNLVGITLAFRMPKVLGKFWWRSRLRIIRRELRNTTSLTFQQSPQFDAEFALRTRAMSIQSTYHAIAKTSRYVINVAPVRWSNERVQAPTLMLSDNSRQANVLFRKAAKRHVGTIARFRTPDACQRPHLERPADFCAAVAAFAREATPASPSTTPRSTP